MDRGFRQDVVCVHRTRWTNGCEQVAIDAAIEEWTPQRAGRYELPRFGVRGVVAPLEADLKTDPCVSGGRDHTVGALEGHGDRLLEKDILPGLRRGDSVLLVKSLGRCDDDRPHVCPAKQRVSTWRIWRSPDNLSMARSEISIQTWLNPASQSLVFWLVVQDRHTFTSLRCA